MYRQRSIVVSHSLTYVLIFYRCSIPVNVDVTNNDDHFHENIFGLFGRSIATVLLTEGEVVLNVGLV